MAVIDSYSETNATAYITMSTGTEATGVGQCFTGDGKKITDAKFYLSRHLNSTTGNAVAKIYAMTGTFGTNGNVGTLLATSDNFDVTGITADVSPVLCTFAFTGAQQYITTNGTNYVVTCEFPGGDATHYLQINYDGTSATHPGTWVFSTDGNSTWTPVDADIDIIFYVDGVSIDVTVNLTGVSATPVIGTGGTVAVTFTGTGNACSPTVGTGGLIACGFTGTGVAATPAIGTGSVTIDGEDEEERPQVVGRHLKEPKPPKRPKPIKPKPRPEERGGFAPRPRPEVLVMMGGVAAAPAIGVGYLSIDGFVFVRGGAKASPRVGTGALAIKTELLDDEMVALLMADGAR